MPFKTYLVGDVLTAADVNDYFMEQAVIRCTSGTRPSSPNEGMAIWETDTDKLLFYTTATTGWQPAWNMPWGVVARQNSSSAQTSVGSSDTDVTGLTGISWTAVANRVYRATLTLHITPSVSGGIISGKIHDGTSAVATAGQFAAGNGAHTLTFHEYFTGISAGSKTWKCQYAISSGTMNANVSSTQKHSFLLEDMGPNGAPA